MFAAGTSPARVRHIDLTLEGRDPAVKVLMDVFNAKYFSKFMPPTQILGLHKAVESRLLH